MLWDEGTILEGKVTGITKFGAFVSLPENRSGMVHISEVSDTYVKDIHDHLSEGDTVRVKVIRITEDGKINLSIRRANAERKEEPGAAPAPARPVRRYAPGGASQPEGRVYPKSSDISFESKLKSFMQESDKKISGSRYYESPRKSRRRK